MLGRRESGGLAGRLFGMVFPAPHCLFVDAAFEQARPSMAASLGPDKGRLAALRKSSAISASPPVPSIMISIASSFSRPPLDISALLPFRIGSARRFADPSGTSKADKTGGSLGIHESTSHYEALHFPSSPWSPTHEAASGGKVMESCRGAR